MKRILILVWMVLVAIATAHADEKGTFVVQDGAAPWYDRASGAGAWVLTGVPDSLKGTGPLPQQNCSGRTLEVPGQPHAITIGVFEKDSAKFKAKYPTAQETGERIAVRNAAGTELPYRVLNVPDPPAIIGAAGDFVAGLLLLKIEGTVSIAPTTPAKSEVPPPTVTQNTGRTFIVRDGAFPWHDRATGTNTWALDSVPEVLKGGGPLPQQNCSSRALDSPGRPRSITIGVSENDVEKFKVQYPGATETGESIAVKNPQGSRIPYRVFTFPNPPAKIGEGAGFVAGLLLLKVEGAASSTAPSSTAPSSTTASEANQPSPSTPSAQVSPTAPAAAGSTIATPAAAPLPAKGSFHIYLLMGQSNMVGRDTNTLKSQMDNPRVLALNGDGQWVVAREPMHVGGTGIGPGIPFALEMLKANPKIIIGLVPCAVGGTPLSRWVKGADLYEKAVSRAKAAAPVGLIKGVLWHQGESDTGKKENAETYEARLTQMFKDLRADLGLPNLPIVIGQLGDFLTPEKYPYVETVRGGIEHIPVVVPGVGYADATGLSHKGDNLHFSADAEKEFGARYAKAMQELQK
jgi:hypothetical protein